MASNGTTRRSWLLVTLILAALLVTGTLYQAHCVRGEASRFPPPGRLVPISGPGETSQRRLHLLCLGEGDLTVIFEPGAFNNATSFSAARQEVSAHARVCSYDRVGTGWSDPGPPVITAGFLADDFKRLTTQAGLRPPFILVPSSMGGIVAEMFARRYPEQVAGMVFVDAGNSFMQERIAAQVSSLEVELACLVKPAANIGLLRLLDPFGLRKERSEAAARSISRLYRVEPMATICGLARGLSSSTREWAAAPPLPPDVPLVVLVHERPYGFLPQRLASMGFAEYGHAIEGEWLSMQQRFAHQSRQGTWRTVPGSDHLIAAMQPHAVASAVIEMVAEVRRTLLKEH